jgi:hypothetical protein
MIDGLKILSASVADFDPIGVAGEPVFMASNQILTLIERELGQDVASVLATPLRDVNQQDIHWYSTLIGDSTCLDNLPPAQSDPVREKLRTKLDAIAGLAAKLSQSSGGSALTYAQLLRAAVRYPDDKNVLVIGGEPVVTFWGFQPANTPSPVRLTPTQKPVFMQAANSSSDGPKKTLWERFGWWLLLLLLILSALWVAGLRGCSADFPLVDKGSAAPTQPSVEPVIAAPVEPAIAAPVEPRLTEEKLKKNDLSVFQGSWELTSGATSVRTGKPVTIDLSFNDEGVGTASVTELPSGNRCEGSASAAIKSGKSFKIDLGRLTCADGNGYNAYAGACNVLAGGEIADCSMTSSANNPFSGTFKRKN